VITKVEDRSPQLADNGQPVRAVDVLAERLPTVTPPAKDASAAEEKPKSAPGTATASGTGTTPKSKPTTGPNNPASGAGQTRSTPTDVSKPAAQVISPNTDASASHDRNPSGTPSKAVAEQTPTSDSTAKDNPR